METLEAIGRQRVVRAFQERPLPAGRRDDHPGCRPPGRIVQEPPALGVHHRHRPRRRWSGCRRSARGAATSRVPRLAIALVTPDPRAADAPLSVMWDLGRAAQNMTLAAWDLGVGSCPATVYEQDACREALGYPADRHCEFILSLGYPADPTDLTRPLQRRRPTRPRLDGRTAERWGASGDLPDQDDERAPGVARRASRRPGTPRAVGRRAPSRRLVRRR